MNLIMTGILFFLLLIVMFFAFWMISLNKVAKKQNIQCNQETSCPLGMTCSVPENSIEGKCKAMISY